MRTFVTGMAFMSILSAALFWLMTTAGVHVDHRSPSTVSATAGEANSLARFEPSSPAVVNGMIRIAQVEKDDVVYDLGCGDGRIVIAAAREHGARGVGVDIDPRLIAESRDNAEKERVSHLVRFRQEDLTDTDISGATVLMLYLSPGANLMLRQKLLHELKPGARIVSHSHDMGEWVPDRRADVDGHRIYSWTVPAHVSGRWKLKISESGAEDAWIEFSQAFQKAAARLGRGQTTVPVTAALSGRSIEFSLGRDWDSVPAGTRFSGLVEKDRMRGTFRSGALTGSWSAERIR